MHTSLDEFVRYLDLAIRAHDAASGALPPGSDEGHFVNENTLVRIDEQLETIRVELRREWIDKNGPRIDEGAPGLDAYVTMRVYRNSIVHHYGTLDEAFYDVPCVHGGVGMKSEGQRRVFKSNYERFCQSVNDPRITPLNPGDKLVLSVRDPDFLLTLINGIRDFAHNVLPE